MLSCSSLFLTQAYIVTVLFTWGERDTTCVMAMLTLHGQTDNISNADFYVNIAHSSVIPTLFSYIRANATNMFFSRTYELSSGDLDDLREREIMKVNIYMEGSGIFTSGSFDNSQVTADGARVELFTTIFILIVWALGVASFVGPVMTLVSLELSNYLSRLVSFLLSDFNLCPIHSFRLSSRLKGWSDFFLCL